MGISNNIILNALEDSFLLAPHTPGVLEYLDIPGIQGRYSPQISHPLANLIAKTTLTPENADATIETVRDQFTAKNLVIGWLVSNLTTPTDMALRLQSAGFVKNTEMAGMSLNDLNHQIRTNPVIRICKTTKSDADKESDLYHRAYPLPKKLTDMMVELLEVMGFTSYFAYVEENDEPVAVASMVYIPNQPIMLLGGAATLPEYRGRGIYTSLVAERIKIAREDGIQTAIIQADRSSSAPIAKKLGFEEHCSLDLYAWTPPQA